jgi:hypothetical protein
MTVHWGNLKGMRCVQGTSKYIHEREPCQPYHSPPMIMYVKCGHLPTIDRARAGVNKTDPVAC